MPTIQLPVKSQTNSVDLISSNFPNSYGCQLLPRNTKPISSPIPWKKFEKCFESGYTDYMLIILIISLIVDYIQHITAHPGYDNIY